MKLLFISQSFPYPPYHDGGRLVIYNLIKHLAKDNKIFLVTFCSRKEVNYLDKIAPFCVDIITVPFSDAGSNKWRRFKKFIRNIITPLRFDSPRMASEIEKTIKIWNPDVVHANLLMMSQYWRAIGRVPKIISSIDSQSLTAYKNWKMNSNLLKRIAAFWFYKQQKWVESHFFPNFDACVVVSDEDKIFLSQHCPELRIEVIPNGVDFEYFDTKYVKDEDLSENPSIGLFGVMRFPPNVDAALYFMSEIYPLIKAEVPDVQFYIVGRYPIKSVMSLANEKNVIVTGEVEDIRTYYNKVSVVVVPTRIGSGIKNTVLQAMSMSKPIVASPQAVKAITVENDVHLMIAGEPAEFAEKIIRLLKNKSLREELGKNGRRLIVNKYSWAVRAEAYQKLYSNILLQKKSSQGDN